MKTLACPNSLESMGYRTSQTTLTFVTLTLVTLTYDHDLDLHDLDLLHAQTILPFLLMREVIT